MKLHIKYADFYVLNLEVLTLEVQLDRYETLRVHNAKLLHKLQDAKGNIQVNIESMKYSV